MKNASKRLAVGALAALLMAGCVVGDGDLSHGDPPAPCTSYPEDSGRCGKPWSGHILQACGEDGEVSTSLHFDRPDVPDSLRVNVMKLGALMVDTIWIMDKFHDTAIVCDQGMCREFSIQLRMHEYDHPLSGGRGQFEFRDSSGRVGDRGMLRLESIAKAECS